MLCSSLLSDIRRVDGFLVESARRFYEERVPEAGEFRGLFVTDREFFDLLERPFGAALPAALPTAGTPSLRSGAHSDRWCHLQSVFGLTQSEADILLLCLLPELDLKYERIYGFLQDDVTCKRPTVDLLLGLLWPVLEQRIVARALFEDDATLASHGLMIIAPPSDGVDSLMRRTVQVAPDVARYLLEDPSNGLPPCAPYWRYPDGVRDSSLYPAESADTVSRLVTSAEPPHWVQVRAQRAWSAKALASDMAAYRGQPLIELRLDELEPGIDPAPRVRNTVREALLHNALLLIRLSDHPGSLDANVLPFAWTGLLEHPSLTVVWYAPASVSPPLPSSKAVRVSSVDLPAPDYEGRTMLWTRALKSHALSDPADLPILAARYRLDGDQVFAAARAAAEHAWQRNPSAPVIIFDDLTMASRGVSAVRLGDLASQIVARHHWAHLILPADRIAQIHEMCDQFRYRHVVYDAWGFGRQSARGQGLSALFAGPSGTGKTMAAEVIANDLALDLYKIDLSGVVSKYIGETEKNLDRIFDLARDSNAILLFDEADALFGKRSETKDAHDRYANIEISYLLQKVEEYDGVVILTSNLRQNLDEAFMRRLQFSIEFPFPDEDSRRQIWERTVPEALPLADDVDMRVLAERFRLSGGSIRNALVNAAFLAARDGEVVAMSHLLWGVRREFQKLGKLIDEGDFARTSGRNVAVASDAPRGRSTR
ncbi:MAG: ATP-binding protein [Anaerolineae bacterium]